MKLNFFGLILFILSSSQMFAAVNSKSGFQWKEFRGIAIQNRGRMKPLDTYFRETAQFVVGAEKWNGFSAAELVFNWLTQYDSGWENEAFVRVAHKKLKEAIGLNPDEKFFAPASIRQNEKLRTLVAEIGRKEARREKLNDFERNAVQLQNQVLLVDYIARGEDMTILPNPNGLRETWFALAALSVDRGTPYLDVERAKLIDLVKRLSESYRQNDPKTWNVAVTELGTTLKSLSQGHYPEANLLCWENFYNSFRPFRWSWISYLIGFIALLGFLIAAKRPLQWIGLVGVVAGLVLHTGGFLLRSYISGRPPVTNMYESVIWVTWGCVLFGMLIWLKYRNWVIPSAASVFAIAGLVLADNLPSVLDAGIHPLEPVLRSNFWLTIHVLTITLGYAAFALSLCLGNVIIGYFLARPRETQSIQLLQLYMYRAVQIGVVLLAAGTILGGVWADYSWGRFWGWDPKEVWALIALLLYLAVLHGRFTGWLKGFGFAATTVICFLGVLMAWYGVNFVLGAGLHSYGFGTGGTGYVAFYTLLQLGFIVAAYIKYRSAAKKAPIDDGIFPKK